MERGKGFGSYIVSGNINSLLVFKEEYDITL